MDRLTPEARVRLSAHTITLKTDEGKTSGLIRGIDTFREISKQPRRQWDAANNSRGAYRAIFATPGAGEYAYTTDGGITWNYLTVEYPYPPDAARERDRCAALQQAGVNVIQVRSRR